MRLLVTGTAGFIGFHLARRLIADGHVVIGFDGRRMTFDDQSLFHAVSDELAASMQGAQLLEEASRMAITVESGALAS